MKFITRKLSVFICVCHAMLFLSSQAWAISLSFNPSTPDIRIGDTFDIDLIISGLENDDIGYFEFNVNFDNSILKFNSYTLDNELGDITAFDAEDWSGGYLGGGAINLIELSYLSDLSFQADSFTMATLSFTSLGKGISALSYSDIILSNDSGEALAADLENGTVIVSSAVPEPSTLFLFGSGLAICLVFRTKQKAMI